MTVLVGTRTPPSLSIVSYCPRRGTACIRPDSRAARSFVSALPLGLEAHLTMFVLSDFFVLVGTLPLVKEVLYLHTNLGDFHPVFPLMLLSRFELACAR